MEEKVIYAVGYSYTLKDGEVGKIGSILISDGTPKLSVKIGNAHYTYLTLEEFETHYEPKEIRNRP